MKRIVAWLVLSLSTLAADDGFLPQRGLYAAVIESGFTESNRCYDAVGNMGVLAVTNGRPIGSYGYAFDGSGNVASSNRMVITNEFTVTAFFRTTTISNMALAGMNMTSPQSYFEIACGDAGLGSGTNAYFSIRDTNGPSADVVISSVQVRDGRPHNLTGVCQDTQILFYVDGSLVSTTGRTANSSGLVNATNGFYFGSMLLQGTGRLRNFSGTQHVSAIWLRALSSNEVFRMATDGIMREAGR